MHHQTDTWPRVRRDGARLRHHPAARDAAEAGTRLDIGRAFDDTDGVAVPTRALPITPANPVRAVPAPPVKPIPPDVLHKAARTKRSDYAVFTPQERVPYGTREPFDPTVVPDLQQRAADPDEGRLAPADFLEKVLDQQHELNLAGSRRLDAVRRRGPGGLFGWRPLAGPSLAEVAAARQRAADAEARRRHAHERHMDRVEIARAYLGVLALIVLVLILGGAAWLGWEILTGAYAWAPTRVQ